MMALSRDSASLLNTKIENRTALVGVIGLGYVGLPLANVYSEAGFSTLGFDIDPEKIEILSSGGNYLQHLGEDFGRKLIARGNFQPTHDFSRLHEADALVICVPTPLG